MIRRLTHTLCSIFCVCLTLLTACGPAAEPDAPLYACAPCPVARAGATAFTLGETAYLIGGRTGERDGYPDDFWQYNPATDTWHQMPDPPCRGRVNAAAVTIDGTVFYGLGYRGPAINTDTCYLRDWWAFDGHNWTRLPDYPTSFTDGAILLHDDTAVYAIMGWYDTFPKDIHKFSLQNRQWHPKWSRLTVDMRAVMGGTGLSLAGRHFAGTGYDAELDNYWAEYTPADGTWTRHHPIPGKPRLLATSTPAPDEASLFVLGGRYWTGPADGLFLFNDIWRFNLADNHWQLHGHFPVGAENMVSFTWHNRVYFGLGEDLDAHRLNTLYYFEN